jgi:murein DD-endopeptidase MepM/ murein hydrolase activator NlpD
LRKKEKKNRTLKEWLRLKYRLQILNESTYEEAASVRLSRLNVIVFTGFTIIMLIVATTFLIAFTGLREFIPGYTDVSVKKNVIDLLQKTDSLDKVYEKNQLYLININRIISGQAPIENLEEYKRDSTLSKAVVNYSRSVEDSLLRTYVEEAEKFDINMSVKRKIPGIGGIFFPPVTGEITQKFEKEISHFGIDIATQRNELVNATLDGTIVLTGWTAETGHLVVIQHQADLISVYKHNSVLLKKMGNYVKAGEPVAIVGNSGEYTTGPHLHFELWLNGRAVDPEDFVSFK